MGWRVLHKDTHWTDGKFMLANSEKELANNMERIIENKLSKFIKDLFSSF